MDIANTLSRTQRFRSRSPPDRDVGWLVSTVAQRTINHSGAAVCAVTGANVTLSDPHYYVTLKCETVGLSQPAEYDHIVVADDTLDELDTWLEDD